MNKTAKRRKQCFYAIIYILSLFFKTPAGAQTISLYDAVQGALKNYPLILQRQAETDAADANIKTVKHRALPSLTLQDQLDAGTANPLQGSYFPLGIVPSTSGNYAPKHENILNAGNIAISYLQWNFFNFGFFRAQNKVANAKAAVSTANLNQNKYLLSQQVVSLYLDWLQKYRLLIIEQENSERAQFIFTAIRATVLSGLKPGVDSSTAAAMYSQARIDFLNAQEKYDYDKIALASFVNLPYDNKNIIPDTNTITSGVFSKIITMNIDDSVHAEHPLLSVYEKQYELQQEQSKVISKKYLPKVALDGAYWLRNTGISPSGVYPNDAMYGMPYSRYNYIAGVTMTYNLFDLQHKQDELAENKFETIARQEALNTEKLTLSSTLQQAISAYHSTIAKLNEIPVQLHAAQQAYEQQIALYRAGLNTLVEVTNAQYALKQAETNLVNTQGDLLEILYIRAALTGQADVFISSFKN